MCVCVCVCVCVRTRVRACMILSDHPSLCFPMLQKSLCAFFFFFCVRCDNRSKSSGWWLLGSLPSAVVQQLAPRAWCPLQCLLAKTVGVLSPRAGRSEACAREFAPQSHIHSGLNQQDPLCPPTWFDLLSLNQRPLQYMLGSCTVKDGTGHSAMFKRM